VRNGLLLCSDGGSAAGLEITGYVGNESAPAKTQCESFGVDAESCSDPDGGDDARVDISIDARSAEAQKPSHLGHRERPLNPLDLLGKGNGWVT